MNEVKDLYFTWLISQFNSNDIALERLCGMLHKNEFLRRVGNDINRSEDGLSLREEFLDVEVWVNRDPVLREELLVPGCSWFEMLLAMSRHIDFLYGAGLLKQFLELVENLDLTKVMDSPIDAYGRSIFDEVDQDLVDQALSVVDNNLFDSHGHNGLFPLRTNEHPDQREVEIWDQQAAYFSEKLEGV